MEITKSKAITEIMEKKARQYRKDYLDMYQRFANKHFMDCTSDGTRVTGVVDEYGNLRFRYLSKSGVRNVNGKIVNTFYYYWMVDGWTNKELLEDIIKCCHIEGAK